jgi:hypothetical protein
MRHRHRLLRVTTRTDLLVARPAGWYGAELADDPSRWTHTFSDAQLAELDDAVASALRNRLGPTEVDRGTFALPTLAPWRQHGATR